MRPKFIIGLVGTNASGKGYVSEYIVKNYGGIQITFSGYLARVLDAMNLERTKENLIKMSVALRREFGEETFSHTVSTDAIHSDQEIVVVDGIRRIGDLANFKPLSEFKLIGIDADPKIRFERMKARVGDKKDDATTTWETFQKKETAPTEVTIPEVIKLVDFQIDNSGTVQDLEKKIDEVMKDIGVPKRA